MCSRVAMDFTGSVSRIVDDPKEAKAIALAESCSWKMKLRFDPWNNTGRSRLGKKQRILDPDTNTTQPWFHVGLSREQACFVVHRYGTVDGAFVVRDSQSNPRGYVITYKCRGKVLHAPIILVPDPIRDTYVYSLDSGVTKFHNLLQLVEFYQLNAGCLPTRLTHYVVSSSNYSESTNRTYKLAIRN